MSSTKAEEVKSLEIRLRSVFNELKTEKRRSSTLAEENIELLRTLRVKENELQYLKKMLEKSKSRVKKNWKKNL